MRAEAATHARPASTVPAAGAGALDAIQHESSVATTAAGAASDTATTDGAPSAEAASAAPAVLEIRGLSFSYGAEPLIRDLDLTVRAGELVALVGDNGSGKSTLMALVTGQLTGARGSIHLFGDDAAAHPHYADIAYVSQDSIRGYRGFPTTIGELVAIHLRHLKTSADTAELLRTVELAGFERRRLSELSGGQLQRVGLLLALIKDARLILLDEPTSAIDRRFSAAFYRILQNLAHTGVAIVVITHHLADAHGAHMRVVRLEDGRCHAVCDDAAGSDGEPDGAMGSRAAGGEA